MEKPRKPWLLVVLHSLPSSDASPFHIAVAMRWAAYIHPVLTSGFAQKNVHSATAQTRPVYGTALNWAARVPGCRPRRQKQNTEWLTTNVLTRLSYSCHAIHFVLFCCFAQSKTARTTNNPMNQIKTNHKASATPIEDSPSPYPTSTPRPLPHILKCKKS